MSQLRSLLPFCMILSSFSAWADDVPEDDADDLPVIGRPVDIPFCGGSGDFLVSVHAEPTRLGIGEPLTLTLAFVAKEGVPLRRPPRRLNIREFPAIAERFTVDPPKPADDRRPAPNRWEFDYRLRPRRGDITLLPSLKLCYHHPLIRPVERSYQTVILDPIPLTIVEPTPIATPLEAPPLAFQLGTGDILRRDRPWSPPGPLAWSLAMAGPPLLSVLWYGIWAWRNPDAARRARQRRSRAARLALAHLRSARRRQDPTRATLVAEAIALYLQQRLDLTQAAPTPGEAREHLLRADLLAFADRVGALLAKCDQSRFGPPTAAGRPDLAHDAEHLILDLERALCQPRS